MSAVLHRVNQTNVDLFTAGVPIEIGSVTVAGDRFVRVGYRLSDLDTGAANFTARIDHFDSTGTVLLRRLTMAATAKSSAVAKHAEQVPVSSTTPALGVWAHDSDIITFLLQSSNANDTDATADLDFIDPLADSSIVHVGKCQSGSTASTIKLASAASAFANNVLNGQMVRVKQGTGFGQSPRVITAWTSATQVAAVYPDWAVTPDNTSVYEVFEAPANVIAVAGDEAEAEAGPIQVDVVEVMSDPAKAAVLADACNTNGGGQFDVNVNKWGGIDAQTSSSDLPLMEVSVNGDKSGYQLASNGLNAIQIGGQPFRTALTRMAVIICGTIPTSGTGAAGSTSEILTLWDGVTKATVSTPNNKGARPSIVYSGGIFG